MNKTHENMIELGEWKYKRQRLKRTQQKLLERTEKCKGSPFGGFFITALWNLADDYDITPEMGLLGEGNLAHINICRSFQ